MQIIWRTVSTRPLRRQHVILSLIDARGRTRSILLRSRFLARHATLFPLRDGPRKLQRRVINVIASEMNNSPRLTVNLGYSHENSGLIF